jgi:uracil-DNA glycosylase
MIVARIAPTFDAWREKARTLLAQGYGPTEVQWASEEGQGLFSEAFLATPPEGKPRTPKVPKRFLEEARLVACAREDTVWELLYRLLCRLQDQPDLLLDSADPDVRRFQVLHKAIKRDIHKMHAFVRFKLVEGSNPEQYVAWHRPDHRILEEATPFFARRFGDKPWAIFTPDGSAHWDGTRLGFGPAMAQKDFKVTDAFDDAWTDYYKSIFNPARISWSAMMKEMPERYWSSLPEAQAIRELIREAPERLQAFAKRQNEQAKPPEGAEVKELRTAAAACTACPIFSQATQVVFGEGPDNARLMIVGEQPGDEEDKAGRPFIGPAGQVLEDALQAVGMKREDIYFTNAVKHFKWTPGDARGKPRMHKTASGTEMHACKPWLEAEMRKIKPKVILALGRTAGLALLGRLVKITEERGRSYEDSPWAPLVVLSWHPSAILRAPTPEAQQQQFNELCQDLALVKSRLHSGLVDPQLNAI